MTPLFEVEMNHPRITNTITASSCSKILYTSKPLKDTSTPLKLETIFRIDSDASISIFEEELRWE